MKSNAREGAIDDDDMGNVIWYYLANIIQRKRFVFI